MGNSKKKQRSSGLNHGLLQMFCVESGQEYRGQFMKDFVHEFDSVAIRCH